MVTRHRTRRHIPRTSHTPCPKRVTIWYNPLHHIRSILLLRLFLSFLPLKSSPNPWDWGLLASSRNYCPWPIWSPTIKHRSSSCLWCYSHMGTPQPNRRKARTSHSVLIPNHPSRLLFYRTSSTRVLWSTLHHCRQCVWRHLFRSNRLPWPTRNYWHNISRRMSSPAN